MIDNKQLLLKNDIFFKYFEEQEELIVSTIDKEFSMSGKSAKDVYLVINSCDGKSTVEEISRGTGLSLEYIEQITNFLKEKNILNNNILKKSMNDSLENLILITKNASDINNEINRIKKTKIGVIGEEKLVSTLTKDLECIFEMVDIDELINIGNDIDLLVVFNNYENIHLLKLVNEIAHETNLKYLRVNLNKEILEVGPLFIPHKTSCYNCFINRTISNLNHPEIYLNFINNLGAFESQIKNYPDLQSLSSSIIKNYIVNYFINNSYSELLLGKEISINLFDFEKSTSVIMKVPNCKFCDI